MENNNYLVEEKKGRATRYYVVLSSSRVDVEDSPSRQRTATGKGSEDSAGDLVCSPRLCFIRLAIYNYNNITLPPPRSMFRSCAALVAPQDSPLTGRTPDKRQQTSRRRARPTGRKKKRGDGLDKHGEEGDAEQDQEDPRRRLCRLSYVSMFAPSCIPSLQHLFIILTSILTAADVCLS